MQLFRSYLTPQQKREHTTKGYITLRGVGKNELMYQYRLFPDKTALTGMLFAVPIHTVQGNTSITYPCCIEVHDAAPPADVALTVLMYYRTGGIEGLQRKLRGASHLCDFGVPVEKEVVKAKSTRSA